MATYVGELARMMMTTPTEDISTVVKCHVSSVINWKNGDYLPKAEQLRGIALAISEPYAKVLKAWQNDKIARRELRREARKAKAQTATT